MALERVKQFKDLIVDYDCSGTGTPTLDVDIWTDMPGGAMASRKKVDLPATAGRQTKVIPLDDDGAYIEGTLVQAKFTPSATAVVRLYGATLRLRPIGVYLDGSLGEFWKTQEIGFGIA